MLSMSIYICTLQICLIDHMIHGYITYHNYIELADHVPTTYITYSDSAGSVHHISKLSVECGFV